MTSRLRLIAFGFFFILMVLPGSAAWAEGGSEVDFNGMWERVGEGDEYYLSVLTVDLDKGAFEEATRPKGRGRPFQTAYIHGRLENIQRDGRRATMHLINSDPLRLTLKPGEDGRLLAAFTRHLTAEEEERTEGRRPPFVAFKRRPEAGAPATAAADLSGVWVTEQDGEPMTMTIDQAAGRYGLNSGYGIARSGFRVVETLPDRLLIDLPDYTLDTTMVMNADGTLSMSSGTDFVENYKRLDLESFRPKAPF